MTVAEQLKEALGNRVMRLETPNPKRVYLTVSPEDLVEAVRFVWQVLDARYVIVSGVDTGSQIELLYHFSIDRKDTFVSLRVFLDRNRPEIVSLSSLIPATEWIEREIWELLGVTFTGHPNLTHLLLADDWPEGNYPLRKKTDGA